MDYNCDNCQGDCCNSTVLTTEEAKSREYEMKQLFDPKTGERFWVLKMLEDGKCIYLNRETWKCDIYEKRPQLCQEAGCEPVEDFEK